MDLSSCHYFAAAVAAASSAAACEAAAAGVGMPVAAVAVEDFVALAKEISHGALIARLCYSQK